MTARNHTERPRSGAQRQNAARRMDRATGRGAEHYNDDDQSQKGQTLRRSQRLRSAMATAVTMTMTSTVKHSNVQGTRQHSTAIAQTNATPSGSFSSRVGPDAPFSNADVVPAYWVPAALPTSPVSMSPSSLFDYEDDGDDGDDANIRGWISETRRHLQSSEMPSSRSPKKRTGTPLLTFHMVDDALRQDTHQALFGSSGCGGAAKFAADGLGADEEDEGRLPTSPTVERIIVQNQKLAARRVQSLPSRVMPFPLSGSSGGSHGGLLLSSSKTEQDGTTDKSKRPATPPIVRRSGSGGYGIWPRTRSSGVKLPERPQSAMKHRSANEYSSGKNVPTIVLFSGSMPRSCGDEDDEQWRTSGHKRRADDVRQPDSDGLTPSPPAPPPLTKRGKYTLHSRASLPKTSFYQRNKREEGSPTPSDRKRRLLPSAF